MSEAMMKPLPEQYREHLWELLVALTPTERTAVEALAQKLSTLAYEFDLNTVEEYDAAIHADARLPYEHPDEWLSLSDFTVMVFESGVDLSQTAK